MDLENVDVSCHVSINNTCFGMSKCTFACYWSIPVFDGPFPLLYSCKSCSGACLMAIHIHVWCLIHMISCVNSYFLRINHPFLAVNPLDFSQSRNPRSPVALPSLLTKPQWFWISLSQWTLISSMESYGRPKYQNKQLQTWRYRKARDISCCLHFCHR